MPLHRSFSRIVTDPLKLSRTLPASNARKRKQPPDHCAEAHLSSKRRRALSAVSPASIAERPEDYNNPFLYRAAVWITSKAWPSEDFAPIYKSWADLKAAAAMEKHIRETSENAHRKQSGSTDLIKKRSSASLRNADEETNVLLYRKKSTASLRNQTGEGKTDLEDKTFLYRDPNFETWLHDQNSFMVSSADGPRPEDQQMLDAMVQAATEPLENPPHSDKWFATTWKDVKFANEAKVIKDLSPLLVPSIALRAKEETRYEQLMLSESVNETWIQSWPMLKNKQPQPDYAVGFARSAFSESQLWKLSPFIAIQANGYVSRFQATTTMYFPFMTCEVKSWKAPLNIADHQNAYSMTVAINGIYKLFQKVQQERKILGQILAFSFSHDHETIKVYGHYMQQQHGKAACFRYPLAFWSFTSPTHKPKWCAYALTNAIYLEFAPALLTLIGNAVDLLPEVAPRSSFVSSAGASTPRSEDGGDEDDVATSYRGSVDGSAKRHRGKRL